MTDVDSQRGSAAPNPGSPEAQAAGCTCPVMDNACPVMDNARGKGYKCIPGLFVYRMDCPVHPPSVVAPEGPP